MVLYCLLFNAFNIEVYLQINFPFLRRPFPRLGKIVRQPTRDCQEEILKRNVDFRRVGLNFSVAKTSRNYKILKIEFALI